jgi:proteasome accessory factor B
VSAAKSERLLNLVILLLVARNYTTKDQIRA